MEERLTWGRVSSRSVKSDEMHVALEVFFELLGRQGRHNQTRRGAPRAQVDVHVEDGACIRSLDDREYVPLTEKRILGDDFTPQLLNLTGYRVQPVGIVMHCRVTLFGKLG